jgi:protein SFI1
MRSNAYTASFALQTWRQVHASHRNALSFAVHYDSAQLRFKMLLAWRLQLRSKLKMVKQGRMAEKFLISRRAWKIWTHKLEEKQRQKKLQDLERRKMRKYFVGKFKQEAWIIILSSLYLPTAWLQRALRDRQRKLAEQEIQHRVAVVCYPLL